jgi:hypothetical protein
MYPTGQTGATIGVHVGQGDLPPEGIIPVIDKTSSGPGAVLTVTGVIYAYKFSNSAIQY